ncbi:uncharacterized protein GLRG_00691 [Colletotrichum graminicola M1.001]|uniref:Uncharacterized protein n=1 Tax=Colletotrichum graminicola (strain M1.001 / M2 / FGSC 10212) TaxID=645133 RepID=E3Q3E5_COLGM|nr:uncharacterized protein GLRG_00691 [Colletotrichum graminicola M1.001]EFQ25547.1 hypothetical protein GLRG_00691 [Colletotrichum graminicola M1.001]
MSSVEVEVEAEATLGSVTLELANEGTSYLDLAAVGAVEGERVPCGKAKPSQFIHSLTKAVNMPRPGLAGDMATTTDGQRRSQPYLRVAAPKHTHTWAYTNNSRHNKLL